MGCVSVELCYILNMLFSVFGQMSIICLVLQRRGKIIWKQFEVQSTLLLVYSAGSGVNRVQVVLSGFSKRLFCLVQAKTLCRYGCMYFLAAFVKSSFKHTREECESKRAYVF